MEPNSTRPTTETRSKNRKTKRTTKKKHTPNEFFLSLSHTKSAKNRFFVVFYITFCVLYLWMRETVQKSRNRRGKKMYSAKRCVYLKLNLSSEFMRTNQHIRASTRSPLIMSVSRSFRPQYSFYCNIEDVYIGEKKKRWTEKNISSHQYTDEQTNEKN